MVFFWPLLFSIICSSIQAKLEDHFKPILDKKQTLPVKGIDFAYLINLDERPEKLAHCLNEFAPYFIEPYRFSAINGEKLSIEVIEDVGICYNPASMQGDQWATTFSFENSLKTYSSIMNKPGKTYFGHGFSPSIIGTLLSHLSVLQDAYECGYKTIWVMEDDIQIIKNPHILSDCIDTLDKLVGVDSWDILFTDKDSKDTEGNYIECKGYAWRPNYTPKTPSRFGKRERIGSFIKTGARYGAYSMILRRSAIEKILTYFKQYNLFLPYDMDFYLASNIQMYTVSEDIVSTLPRAISDSGFPNFLNKTTEP